MGRSDQFSVSKFMKLPNDGFGLFKRLNTIVKPGKQMRMNINYGKRTCFRIDVFFKPVKHGSKKISTTEIWRSLHSS